MPEVQYDPSSGEANLTRGFNGPIPQPSDEGNNTISNSPEELEQHRFNTAGRGLGQRARTNQFLAGITDQDLDEGTFDPSHADLELQLQEVQQKQSRATSPVEAARFAAEAERLASLIVTGQATNPTTQPKITDKDEDLTVAQELADSGVDVQASLTNAGEVLSDESAEAWNSLLQSQERGDQIMAAKMMHNLRTSPEMFVTDLSQYEAMPDAMAADIAAEFGGEIAKNLQLLSISIKEGVCTPAEAYRLHQKDDKTAKAINTLMRRGTIVMPI